MVGRLVSAVSTHGKRPSFLCGMHGPLMRARLVPGQTRKAAPLLVIVDGGLRCQEQERMEEWFVAGGGGQSELT